MTLVEVMTAAVPKVFNVVGNYVRIKGVTGSSGNSISIDIIKNGQKLPIDLTTCDVGDFARVVGGFDQLLVTSSVSQTLSLQVAQGDVGSNNFSISGAANVSDAGRDYGASVSSNALLGVGGTETIVAPGANLNGLIVVRGSFYTANGTSQAWVNLHAKTSAPASAIDGDVLLQPDNYIADGVNRYAVGKVERVIRVAAGKGLYWRNNSGVLETGAGRTLQYTLL